MMGQSDVIFFLKQNRGKWFTSKQISEKLKRPINQVTFNLRRARTSGFIDYKFELGRDGYSRFFYKY